LFQNSKIESYFLKKIRKPGIFCKRLSPKPRD
jgi:hypothetical protein